MTDEYSEVWYEIETCEDGETEWYAQSPTHTTEAYAEQAIKRGVRGLFEGCYKTRVVEVTQTRKAIVKETAVNPDADLRHQHQC